MTDPKRLAEQGSEASDALRGLLRASRDELPNAERLQGSPPVSVPCSVERRWESLRRLLLLMRR